MNVRSSTRATSVGSEAHQNEFGFFCALSRMKVPGLDEQIGDARPLLGRAIDPLDAVRLGQLGGVADPREQPACWVVGPYQDREWCLPSLRISSPVIGDGRQRARSWRARVVRGCA